jgi:hypothetical protein
MHDKINSKKAQKNFERRIIAIHYTPQPLYAVV